MIFFFFFKGTLGKFLKLFMHFVQWLGDKFNHITNCPQAHTPNRMASIFLLFNRLSFITMGHIDVASTKNANSHPISWI